LHYPLNQFPRKCAAILSGAKLISREGCHSRAVKIAVARKSGVICGRKRKLTDPMVPNYGIDPKEQLILRCADTDYKLIFGGTSQHGSNDI
jgi:hypothetical protein